jgi:hypothetical protein
MILQLLTSFIGNASQCSQLEYLLSEYIRMYEPHSSREYRRIPDFHNLVSAETFKELGEKFEEIEEQNSEKTASIYCSTNSTNRTIFRSLRLAQ